PLRVASPVRELVSVAVIPAVPPAGQPASERLNAFDAKLLVAEPFAVWVDELADVEHARVIRTRRAVDPDDGVKHLPLAVRERSRRRTFRAEPHELDARPPRLRLERTVFVDALEHRPHEWARHFVGLALFDVVGSHLSLVRWLLDQPACGRRNAGRLTSRGRHTQSDHDTRRRPSYTSSSARGGAHTPR